ncbi:NfeD family protein [Alteribacillus sp. JSM 102045]|uniref:NfeD family protein n=1 Tax=Alteribacillus sp. JSM 102045 TaxID=1562101 RepID=UPI0035C25E78
MELLNYASIGFLIVFFGTVFLMGEMLVKAKGLFAVLGITFMSLFFSFHIDTASSMWILILYAAGIGLIILDGKVISDGTIAVFGALLMSLGLAVPTPSITYGVLVVLGFIIGLFTAGLFLKVFPRRNLWAKITLRDRLSGDLGYNSMSETYKALEGKEGKTITPFRPIGTISIEGNQYSATSGGQWLEADEQIKVVSVDGTRILVKRKENVNQEKEKELE